MLEEISKEWLEEELRRNNRSHADVAKELGVSKATLWRRCVKLGIRKRLISDKISKDQLYTEYFINKKNIRTIAREYHVDLNQLYIFFEECGFELNFGIYDDIFTKEFLEQEYQINGKSLKKIADEYDVNVKTIQRYFHRFGLPTKKRIRNILGQTFNDFYVEAYDGYCKEEGKHYWKCICINKNCGNIRRLTTSSLTCNGRKSCGCTKKTGFGDIGGEYWGQVRTAAKGRSLNFDITIEEAWEQFNKQDGKCHFTGLNLHFCKSLDKSRNGQEPPQTASLDRLYSDKGYYKENVVWVHRVINIMKSVLTPEEFVTFCKLVANKFIDFEMIDISKMTFKCVKEGLKYHE